MKHYNEVQDVSLTDDDFLKILNGIGKSDALIVMIVDIFDFNGSWLPGLHRFVGNNKILLVGNKVDLLPKSVNHNKLINWMKHEAKELGLKPEDVFLVSAQKANLLKKQLQLSMNCVMVKMFMSSGVQMSENLLLLIRIIKEVTGEGDVITTSHFPGQPWILSKFLLMMAKSLIDSPGIINHHQMAHFVDKKDLKIITPKKEIKPKVFQLNEGQTLFFGGLARFDYISGWQKIICLLCFE